MQSMKSLLLAGLLMTLSACQILGISPADTFNKKLYEGYTTIEAIANATNTLLITGQLSRSDAQNILEQEQNVKAALDIARSVHDVNPEQGDAKLASALIILQALQRYVGSIPPVALPQESH